MAQRECYHCKQLVDESDDTHDCWTTTEAALTADLSGDLREAWERLRESAAEFGEQRIYASHNSIMFARKACYFFVRPKKSALEVCIFLGRTIKAAQVRRTDSASQTKVAHIIHVTHRDEVESPITDWLREAYDTSDALSARGAKKGAVKTKRRVASKAAPKKKAAAARAPAGRTAQSPTTRAPVRKR